MDRFVARSVVPALLLGLVAPFAAGCGGQEIEGGLDDSQSSQATAECVRQVDVVIYTEDGFDELADGLAANSTPCAEYYLSLPALANEKTQPRGPLPPARMRARGAQFHAMAEFHWGGWAQVTDLTWYEKGVEFRRRMEAAGYDVTAGDTWAINEIPSSARYDETVRDHVRNLVRGLHDGAEGAPPARGAVFAVGMGQKTTNLGLYKAHLESWLADAPFWRTMNAYTRFWGQETYTDPDNVCMSNVIVATRSAHVNEFIQHELNLARAGGSVSSTAAGYLGHAYAPLINAAFRSPAYQTTGLTLHQMESFVSTEIYASRARISKQPGARARLGMGWTWARSAVSPEEIQALAARIASAIHYAYSANGGAAAGACSPSRAYTWCQCAVVGAWFNEGWQTFETW